MVASLIFPELSLSERFSKQRSIWERLAGGKKIHYDNTVYLSERSTADTNRALSYLMSSRGAFPEGTDINENLEFYFMLCSL